MVFSVFFASYHFVSHPKYSISLQNETSETNLFGGYFASLIFAFVSLPSDMRGTLSRPLTNRLKYFRIKFRFRRDIDHKVRKNFHQDNMNNRMSSDDMKNMMSSSQSSNQPGAKYQARQGMEFILFSQTAATTFAFPSIIVLLLWDRPRGHIYFSFDVCRLSTVLHALRCCFLTLG